MRMGWGERERERRKEREKERKRKRGKGGWQGVRDSNATQVQVATIGGL